MDKKCIGGFYESIMAMMVVTIGVLILTTSLTFISVRKESEAPPPIVDAVMESLLGNSTFLVSERMLDAGRLAHFNLSSEVAAMAKGIKVMLVYEGEQVAILYQQGEWNGSDRASRSEPVNVFFNHADVRPAQLMVWVWQ